MDLLPVVLEKDGIPVTTSKAVAEQFEKRHQHVIRAIEDLKPNLTAQFWASNFFKSEYENRGKEYPYYIMTKDGFTMLVMGFTGAKAIQFKEAYITAFNQMQKALLGGGLPAPALQSIEQRLQALEQTAGAGKPDAVLEVGATFLQAIRTAIESGEYYISRPYSKTAETGKQLGRRERTETVLIAKTAYKVYAEYTAHPLARLTLWSVLEQIGTIEARERDSAPMVASFKECKAGAIYIKNEKLERR